MTIGYSYSERPPYQVWPYRPAPLTLVVVAAPWRIDGRPLLEMYLDEVLSLHDILTPYSEGATASRELQTLLYKVTRVADFLMDRARVPGEMAESDPAAQAISALGELLQFNAANVRSLILAAGEESVRRFRLERIVRNETSPTAESELLRIRASLDELARIARISLAAITNECSLIWTAQHEVTYTDEDLDAALRDVGDDQESS